MFPLAVLLPEEEFPEAAGVEEERVTVATDVITFVVMPWSAPIPMEVNIVVERDVLAAPPDAELAGAAVDDWEERG